MTTDADYENRVRIQLLEGEFAKLRIKEYRPEGILLYEAEEIIKIRKTGASMKDVVERSNVNYKLCQEVLGESGRPNSKDKENMTNHINIEFVQHITAENCQSIAMRLGLRTNDVYEFYDQWRKTKDYRNKVSEIIKERNAKILRIMKKERENSIWHGIIKPWLKNLKSK